MFVEVRVVVDSSWYEVFRGVGVVLFEGGVECEVQGGC